jgi:Glycosyltransferase family 87
VLLWAGVFLLIVARVAVSSHRNSVYPIFAQAGQNWLAGASLCETGDEPYRYSPLVAVCFVPFSLLPDAPGAVLWRLLNGGVFLMALAWWSESVLPGRLTRTQRAVLFLLVLPLAVGNLNNGQSNLLVLGLILTAVTAMAGAGGSSRDTWRCALAAACLALACLFKVYPIAVGLLLVVIYPGRLGWRMLLALALGLGAPFLFQHPGYVAEQYTGWLHHLRTDDRQGLAREYWYRDVRLLCEVGGCHLSGPAYVAVQLATAAACAALCWAGHRLRWPRRRLLTLLTALGCSWMTVFGSATESATYILSAPVAAWVLLEASLRQRALWLQGLLFLSYGLFLAAQVAGWFPLGRAFQTQGVQPLAGLILLAGVLAGELIELRRRRGAANQLIGPCPQAGAAAH